METDFAYSDATQMQSIAVDSAGIIYTSGNFAGGPPVQGMFLEASMVPLQSQFRDAFVLKTEVIGDFIFDKVVMLESGVTGETKLAATISTDVYSGLTPGDIYYVTSGDKTLDLVNVTDLTAGIALDANTLRIA